MAQTWRQEVQESQDIQGLPGDVAINDVAINDVAIDDAAIGVATGQTAVQSATHAISRHRTSIGIVSLALAVVALAIVEGLILRSNTADHVAEMRLILAADARWVAFVPAAHTIAVCFSAVVAVPVIVVLLGVIWAVTRSAGQMLRGLAMAALPMAVVGLIKTIVDRPRPSTARGALMPDPSFPSGHTACSVVVVSLALFALQVIDVRIKDSRGLADTAPQSSRPPLIWRVLRTVLTVILAVVPFVVALSRVIYGVHYPTDVCTSLVLTPVLVWCVYRLCDPAR
ncbi:phosphatase PAP2 family protein [Bifidobacterium thermacidophilum]|uniref:PAP2 family protein n=1 Tax=Bifidobacterium thermacidophilum subsp. thermacidophilum TaxID=79262 RepID=A0A087E2E4_9BIFI|nr:phosphatase PAP2 family protein [Bifidobacterium thermacidophilum]KFJ01945.1 PAP2 family protein [Bifidobacterium thermacidophilum subsp. thermacidophilum]